VKLIFNNKKNKHQGKQKPTINLHVTPQHWQNHSNVYYSFNNMIASILYFN